MVRPPLPNAVIPNGFGQFPGAGEVGRHRAAAGDCESEFLGGGSESETHLRTLGGDPVRWRTQHVPRIGVETGPRAECGEMCVGRREVLAAARPGRLLRGRIHEQIS